jgi:hypothetical protein
MTNPARQTHRQTNCHARCVRLGGFFLERPVLGAAFLPDFLAGFFDAVLRSAIGPISHGDKHRVKKVHRNRRVVMILGTRHEKGRGE